MCGWGRDVCLVASGAFMLLTLLRISDNFHSRARIGASVFESPDEDNSDTDTVETDRSTNPEEVDENTRVVTDFGLFPVPVSPSLSSVSSTSLTSASSLSTARKTPAAKSKESRKEPVATLTIMAKSKESRRQKHLSRLEAKKGEALVSGVGLSGDVQHVGAATGPNDAAAVLSPISCPTTRTSS
jgi:hypothetical protein